jgi:hypothetical protein
MISEKNVEVFVAELEVTPRHIPGRSEKNQKNLFHSMLSSGANLKAGLSEYLASYSVL